MIGPIFGNLDGCFHILKRLQLPWRLFEPLRDAKFSKRGKNSTKQL